MLPEYLPDDIKDLTPGLMDRFRADLQSDGQVLEHWITSEDHVWKSFTDVEKKAFQAVYDKYKRLIPEKNIRTVMELYDLLRIEGDTNVLERFRAEKALRDVEAERTQQGPPQAPAEAPGRPTQDDPPQVEDDPPLERLKDYGNYNPTDWIIRNWIPRSETTILAGPGGIGKSRLCLQLAAAVATGGGIDVFHEPDGMKSGEVFKTERQAHVMFLSWEDRGDTLKKRMNDLSEHPAIDIKLLEQYLHVFDMRGRGALYQPTRGSRHISTIATKTALLDEITAYAKTFDVKLIFIDTIAAVFLSDENSRPLVRQFLNSMTAIADELDAAIVLLCHPPKQSGVQFSGSTDWVNGARSALSFEYATQTDQPVFSVAKSNLGPRPDPIYFHDTSPYYVAGVREIPEAKESAPLRQCAGYEGFECDKETRGRAQRCPECKKTHDKLRWKKTHSS